MRSARNPARASRLRALARIPERFTIALTVTLLSLLVAAPALAEDEPGAAGTFSGFALQQAVRAERPERDTVGGFQFSIIGGVQLRGSASGQGGLAFGYYKRSTAAVGLELEAAFNRGPSGEVIHALASIVFQSGARSSRMVPYAAIGAGMYRAREKLRDSVAAELPDFGIEPTEGEESGPLVAFGFGVRYYLNDGLSFRADYREFRALTGGEDGFFDRLFALRRIGGFLSFEL